MFFFNNAEYHRLIYLRYSIRIEMQYAKIKYCMIKRNYKIENLFVIYKTKKKSILNRKKNE